MRRGDYRLTVPAGAGPAGVRRADGADVALDIEGGRADFRVEGVERVYFWWRGAERRDGVELARRRPALARPRAERKRDLPSGGRVATGGQVA